MDNKTIEKNEEIEIDLKKVFSALVKKIWLITAVSVISAVVLFVGTFLFITPKYKAAAKFYVHNSAYSAGNASVSISNGDLVTSRGLVDSYIVILNTRETLLDVINYAGVNRSPSQVMNMISAEAVDNTEIFQVTVTSTSPSEAEAIANAIAYTLPNRIVNIIEGTSAKVVEYATEPVRPSSPSYVKNTMIGFMLGFVLISVVVVLKEILDITIRSEEDITQLCNLPILTTVPDLTVASKGGYYSNYARASEKLKKANAKTKAPTKKSVLIGANMCFAAQEAYKLLRTKLQFSFAGENDCRVIAISSSLSGEGKSLTSINLAFSLSQLGKRVVLIDCDMRRPTLADKLKIYKKPGLSSYLTGQTELANLVQYCGIETDEKAFHVIAAGHNPPNPVELLSSTKMDAALNTLRNHYDYVILDMPPIGEVTDALAVANKVDGMLLVVRQNLCNRIALSDAVSQFGFVNMKILGVVFNGTTDSFDKNGKQYYKQYQNAYMKSASVVNPNLREK